MGLVSLIGCASYDQAAEKLEALLAPLGGIGAFIKPGMRVLVKPNAVLAAKPETAICTHPSVCAAVCRLIVQAGATPVFAESPGGPFAPAWVNRALDISGIGPACEASGALRNTDFSSREVPCPNGKVLSKIRLINAALDCDAIINVCKLKTHGMMHYTGAVKNLFGLAPGREKPMMHARFPDDSSFAGLLNDICLTVSPVLHIIDGIIGMEGDGPTSGTPRALGVLLAAANPWDADHIASDMIGVKFAEFPQNRDALARGLYDPEAIEVLGDTPADFACEFQKPSTFARRGERAVHVPALFQRILRTRPVMTDQCVGCGICAENCPVGVIQMRDKRPAVRTSKCIRCYCCQELCPKHAVEVKQSRLARFLERR